ncbi:MAG TPA: hypothetical protein VK524_00865 [Polyangiaceae bacterium]|nr:hypothetical protein [Polyangiaceae bacterium]
MTRSPIWLSLVFMGALACSGQTRPAETAGGEAPVSEPSAASNTPAPQAASQAVVRYKGFSSPESVLYDADADRYLVSNIHGKPIVKDNNGFISVLSPAGEVTSLKWIAGGKNGVRLDAPTGLTIASGVLYVADISTVRTFDLKTGAAKGDIPIPGSTFVYDLTTGDDGKVYLSDAGPPTGRFDAVGTEAVYVIEGKRVKPLAKGKLGRPTSIVWTERGLVVAPFGASELYRLDGKGSKLDVTKTPAGGLAGIVKHGDWLFVTSFEASSIFRGKLGGTFEVALANQETPADIGYDTRRARLLVPHFVDDTVSAFAIQ